MQLVSLGVLGNCVLKYFKNKVEDAEVKPIIEYALGLTTEHLDFKNSLFHNEKFPVPVGFTEDDVNVNAPRLFSDGFMLLYLRNMGIAGTTTYSMAMASSSRADIRAFFNHNLKTTAELLEKSTTLLQSKGILPRTPYTPYPEAVEYVHKEGWLNGLFGDRRPLNVSEITHLFLNTMTNTIGEALMMAFGQVAKSEDVVKHIVRGRDISKKHIEVFGSFLRDDDLPAPMTWETDVTDSTESPFSEKLMLYHTVYLSQLGLGNYGAALAGSPRRDISVNYSRLAAEIGTYADDGAEIMIKKKWLEKMPGAIERDALLTV